MSVQSTAKQAEAANLLLPRKIKSQQTMDKVYTAVGEMLREYGYDYLTMRNICERAGVAYSSVYHFFGSKEQLVYQYCRLTVERLMERCLRLVNYNTGNFIEDLIWPVFVYLVILEEFGWQTVSAVYHGKNEDIYWSLYGKALAESILHGAFSRGYMIPNGRNRDIDRGTLIKYIKVDLQAIINGAVLTWCRDEEGQRKDRVNLHELCIRLLNSFLLSWASPRYKEEFLSDWDDSVITYFNPETRDKLVEAISDAFSEDAQSA